MKQNSKLFHSQEKSLKKSFYCRLKHAQLKKMDWQFLQILGSFFSPTIVDLNVALPFNNGPITN